ncbi:hypothetical protein G9A89_016615 [Geosiphon pyriformis]|nr:hypothetical protein G9A89_016615 [Geosiphon pyriformis]
MIPEETESGSQVVFEKFSSTCNSSTSVFGHKNYTEFTRGHIPLIISIPHGGHKLPEHIPNREKIDSSVNIFNDNNTQEIGCAIAERMLYEFGRPVYMVVNHLHRRKVDVNRPFEQGTDSNRTSKSSPSDSQIAWRDYHEFMKTAVKEVEGRFGRGLVIDLHGHAHQKNYIEVGYLLSAKILALPVHTLNTNTTIHQMSSIRALFHRMAEAKITFTSLLRADILSLGGRLQMFGYDAVPSQAHHFPTAQELYLSGGYSVRNYGSSNGGKIDAIQLELPSILRIGKGASDKFITDLADSISWFLREYYWGNIERKFDGLSKKKLTMINRDLLQLLIYLSLPFLLQKVSEWLRRRANPSQHLDTKQPSRPFTKAELGVSTLLISTIIYHFHRAFFALPFNIFQKLNVSILTPASHLKALLTEQKTSLALSPPELDTLIKKLGSFENKYFYVTYGQKALIECNYCREATDYLYFILPGLAASYVTMITIIGLATMLKRKQDWRIYCVVFLVVCAAFDIYTFTTLDISLLISTAAEEHHFTTADFYRRLAFIICTSIVLYMNKKDMRTEAEILNDITRRQEYILGRLKGASLQRTAVLRDSALRKAFVEYYKRVEVEEGVIYADPEYKKAKATALAKLNVDALTKDAELYVENLTRIKESESVVAENELYAAANSADIGSSTDGTSGI